MAERCPTCGGAVKIVGKTTLHYDPVAEQEIERLQKELADCTRDCRKAGERFEQALDLLVEVGRFFDNEVGWEELRVQVQAYLASE